MEKIKVLLVDDQLLFVESLEMVIETRAEDIKVVGIAKDGKEAVDLVLTEKPDIILMDIRMPGMNGVDSTKIITNKYPDIKVLVLTTFDDDEYVIEALRYGAYGYLTKDVPPVELFAAIRAVYQGGITISPKVASKLINMVNPSTKLSKENIFIDDNSESSSMKGLSKREKEVLELMARGLENKDIAGKLFIAEQTVKNYVSMIYSKLGVHDRVQAALIAMKEGIV